MLRPFTLFALLYLAVQQLQAAVVAIALRPDVEVNGARFRLSDIATVYSQDGDTGRRVADVEVGVSPRPHHRLRLSQQQIERLLEAKAPQLRGRLEWRGSKATTIRVAGMAMDREHITRMAADFLQGELSGKYDKLEVSPIESSSEITLPAGARLKPRVLTGVISRRMPVWIDIHVAGHPYAAIPVWFAVSAWKQIPVARAELSAGTELKPEDFVLEQRDVAQMPKALPRLPEQRGTRLRTALAQGMPLTDGALEVMPAISRNQEVTVRMTAGAIVIETAGVAQADGRIGETVKVKNPGSSEIFLAKVSQPGLVLVNAR